MVIRQSAAKIGKILPGIPERIGLGTLLQRVFRDRTFKMFESHNTFETELARGSLKGSDRNGVVERVVEPTQTGRLRTNRESGSNEPEIVALAGPEHHSMLAQTHRFEVAIFGNVAHR